MNPTDLQPDPPERDLCDELLAPPVPPADVTPLREQILRRTTRWLRWRRRLRRIAFVAALAACWAGGMFTMRWLSPPAPQLAPTPQVSVEPTPGPTPTPSARALEWQAIDSEQRQAELSRKAGDLYLKQEHDPLSAVRCYGRALDAAPEQATTVSTDDEWLLMAIKDARKKEKRDAKTVD
jgi:hypothetical protein